jgi:hypothetical protein
MEGYVVNEGVVMPSNEPLTDEQYQTLRLISMGLDHAPKQCFHNAQMLTLQSTWGDEPDRVKYHEGYVALRRSGGMPILHAWITLDDSIVDVTLSTDPESSQRFLAGEPPQEDLRDRVLGEIPDGWEYIGVPMETDYVVSTMMKNQGSRSLIDNWQDGWPLLQKPKP